MFCFDDVSPESLGISSQSILDFIRREKEHSNELHSLQVIRHGKRCFFGCFAPYNKEAEHILFSFSKSLTSTAIGFAEQEGLLNLKEKLVDIFPEKCPEKMSDNLKEADIYSLLTMTCGHAQEIHVSREEEADWIRIFLAHEFTYRPGTTFQYNTAGTNLLAAILRKRSGLNVTEYLKPRLFDVIGIPAVECWKIADGTEMGGAGMYLSPESMARFAQFVLNKGSWEGRQLLSADWFERASARQVASVSEVYPTTSSEWMQGYGFQYWRCTPEGSFRADGAYGQFAVFYPKQDAAVIITSCSSDTNTLLTDLHATIFAGMTDEAQPADEKLFSLLRRAEETLSIPAIWGLRNHDEERRIEGAVFKAEKDLPALAEMAGGAGKGFTDEGRLLSVSFAFKESSVILTAVQDNGSFSAEASFAGCWKMNRVCGREYGLAARWAAKDTLVIDTRCTRAATGSRLKFVFTDNRAELSVNSSYPCGWGLADTAAAEPVTFVKQ